MKNNFKFRLSYLLAIAFLMLLINSCGPTRKVERTTKTTIIAWDSTIISPRVKTTFRSSVPCCEGDSIVLTDRKTGVQLKIKEFVSLDTVLAFWVEPTKVQSTLAKIIKNKPIRKPPTIVTKKEYEFEIIHPEKEIPIKLNKTVVEETETVTVTKKVPWYYKWSLKFVIWLLVAAVILFILKRFMPWQYLKR